MSSRKRKNSDSSMDVSRDTRRRLEMTSCTPPTTFAPVSRSSTSAPSPFDDKTDLLIEILLHTDKSNILYTRSAADLTLRFKSVRLGFQQLSDYLLSKGVGGEKMDELMDVMEPAMGAGITTVLSQDALREKTIVAMIQRLIQVGQDKFGTEFCHTARLLFGSSEAEQPFHSRPSSAVQSVQPSPSSALTQLQPFHSRPPSISTQARPVYPRPSSVLSTRPEVASLTQKAAASINDKRKVMGQEMDQEEQSHQTHRVFVGMYRRLHVSVGQQGHAILMAAKAQLGQHCGVKACEHLPGRGFALEIATQDQVSQVVGKEITVYEECLLLAPFHDDRPRDYTCLPLTSHVRSSGDSWRPPRAYSPSSSHVLNFPTERTYHRVFSAFVPVSVAPVIEQNAVRAIANEFPSLNFSLQRQTSTKLHDKRWVLCFNGLVRPVKSGLRITIGRGTGKLPFELVFEAVSRAGAGCLVCRKDHQTTDCTFIAPFPECYQLPSGQYLMKVPENEGTRLDYPIR